VGARTDHAFVRRWYDFPKVTSVLLAAFERWLGFVHIEGVPGRRHSREVAEKAAQEIRIHLGSNIRLGSVTFNGYPLTLVDDDGQMRLARVALAVISHLPAAQFVHSLAIGFIAEVITGRSEKYDLFSWVLRSSRQDIWTELKSEVDRLLSIDNPVMRKVVRRLLSLEGSALALEIEKEIPVDVVTSNPFVLLHEQDPCTSGFQWGVEDCVKCVEREDLPPEVIARQIGPYCVDPDFSIPSYTKIRLETLPNKIDKKTLWMSTGTTEADHWFDQFEPVLAAHLPAVLCNFICSIARQITERTDLDRRQLSIHLIKHYIVLQDRERQAVRGAWQGLLSSAADWSDTEGVAEEYLFKILLSEIDGDTQLLSFLSRPERAFDLVDFEISFESVKNWVFVADQLSKVEDTKPLTRCLWFISKFPLLIPKDLINTSILGLIGHKVRYVCSLALEIIYKTKESNAVDSVITSTWSWVRSDDGQQNHWGSLILCDFGQKLSFEEICARIHPGYLGYAILQRGSRENEIEAYTQRIHQTWLGLMTSKFAVLSEAYKISLDHRPADGIQHLSRLSLDQNFDTSITFIDQFSTRGGLDGEDDLSLDVFDSRNIVDRNQKLLSTMKEIVAEQRGAGNTWFADRFNIETLHAVIEVRPELLTQWLTYGGANNTEKSHLIFQASSFYAALCLILLEKRITEGIQLYWDLQETRTRVRLVDGETRVELLDFAFFRADSGNESTRAWERKLESCSTDQELMTIALIVQDCGNTDWLWSYIVERLDSRIPIDRARSRVLLGFFDSEKAGELIQRLCQNDTGSWPAKLSTTAKKRQDMNKWAKHWYSRFLTAEDDVDAWSAFRLLLRCVNSSFWFWRARSEVCSGDSQANGKRNLFLQNNLDTIRNAIKNNERELADQFLGQKGIKGQVWPWM
jgi:hypothetical protein